jgi:RNA polymerase sigma-70 factor (ECF subfamily)
MAATSPHQTPSSPADRDRERDSDRDRRIGPADLTRLRRTISRFDLAVGDCGPPATRRQRVAPLPPADAALVAAALGGDHRAFQELVGRHRAAVRATALRRLRDRDAVDDVVQEAFLRAFVRLGTLRDGSRFGPWVLQIARNAALDAVRRRCRAAVSADVDVDEVQSGHGDEPPAAYEFKQLQRRMRHGMARLSERDRAALTLVGDGGGPAEVADALGVSAATAKVVVHRARRRLLAMIA